MTLVKESVIKFFCFITATLSAIILKGMDKIMVKITLPNVYIGHMVTYGAILYTLCRAVVSNF